MSIWPEELPHDVRERIVHHCCNGVPTRPALHLAQASSTLREAVLAVVGTTFDATQYDEDCMSAWRVLLSSTPTRAILNVAGPTSTWIGYELHSWPALRCLTVTDRMLFSSWPLPNLSTVKELTLYAETIVDKESAVAVLSNFELDKLSFGCRGYRLSCGLQVYDCRLAWSEAVVETCPKLTSLSVDCDCTSWTEDDWQTDPFLHAIERIQSVTEFTFTSEFPRILLPRLTAMNKVGLLRSFGRFADIGNALTTLQIHQFHELSPEEVMSLANCARLEHLETGIHKGGEEALLSIANQLPLLQSLLLRWHPPFPRRNPQWLSSKPGVILSITRALPLLKNLRLSTVEIAEIELIDIMKWVGKRMERFQTSIIGQSESPQHRLASVLCTAMQYNTEMKSLIVDVDKEPLDACSPGLHLRYDGVVTDSYVWKSCKPYDDDKVKLLLRKLHCLVPRLSLANDVTLGCCSK